MNLTINDIYIQYALNCTDRYLFLFGGAGSGKSYAAMQKKAIRVLSEPKHKMLYIRKVGTTIKDSIFAGQKGIFSNLGVLDEFSINKIEKTMVHDLTGNEIIMKGVDDQEKLKSIDGITSVFIEEVTELREDDFLQIDLRLRGETQNYKQIVACFNPIDSNHWLVPRVEPQLKGQLPSNIVDFQILVPGKVWRFATKSEQGDKIYTTVLNTTYKDNHLIDNEYKAQLRNLASISDNHYTVYEKGRWGKANIGDRYAHKYTDAKHCKSDLKHLDDVPYHYTVDFNVSPYMSGLVIQYDWVDGDWMDHEGYWDVRVLDEYSLSYPENESYYLGSKFIQDYASNGLFYLYGDASGKNAKGVKGVKSHFHDVEKGFGEYNYLAKHRIPNSNPRYQSISKDTLGRRDFLNAVLDGSKVPIRLRVSDKCINFLDDLRIAEQDENGRLAKKKTKGIELRGHHLDAFQYFLCHPKTFGKYAKIR